MAGEAEGTCMAHGDLHDGAGEGLVGGVGGEKERERKRERERERERDRYGQTRLGGPVGVSKPVARVWWVR